MEINKASKSARNGYRSATDFNPPNIQMKSKDSSIHEINFAGQDGNYLLNITFIVEIIFPNPEKFKSPQADFSRTQNNSKLNIRFFHSIPYTEAKAVSKIIKEAGVSQEHSHPYTPNTDEIYYQNSRYGK